MRLRKYAVVRHDWADDNHVIPIHHLINDYHWVAIDAAHVFLTCHYRPINHAALDSHPAVLLLPSLQTTIPVHTHAGDRDKHHLFEPLKALGVDHDHIAQDVVARMVRLHGARFEPEI